ncbi:glycine receptor subunit alpha-2-like [Centruroides vittatus]|uniref:glycine receptor subunit alpha-2-like n=1 Tax=Centruroides vittatus TaxID=120091 RepID=UPI00350E99BB
MTDHIIKKTSVCQRKVKQCRKHSSDIRLIIVGDDQLQFLDRKIQRGKCKVNVESIKGLTISAAEKRLYEISSKINRNDIMIVHCGSNDIIPELNKSAALVSQKLKQLIDRFRRTAEVRMVISSILPNYEDFSNFNRVIRVINTVVKQHALNVGIDYVDHTQHFWKDGKIKEDLYNYDGSLNEDGKRTFEDNLFDNEICERKELRLNKPIINGYESRTALELKDILPLDRKMYDKFLPPKQNGDPTIVDFHVTVLSVDSIDEESMTYVTDIFLAQSWKDYRLRLPENMTEDYRILNVEWLKYIWRPDSFFKNAKKVTFHDMTIPNHYLWLYHDKSLLYMAKLTLELSCAMKFEAYPHDTQSCSMMIESLSHTTDDLIFRWNESSPLVVNTEIELPQLDIVHNTTEYCTLEYSTGNFTCLAVVFNLKRRLGYHLFHTYVPTTLIVSMSWISFWIRPEAIPARVTLGVTSLLTLATQNTQSQSSLPPVSYIKAIDVWMSSCTVFVFMSLMEFALVNYFMGYTGANQMMRGYSTEDMEEKILRRLSGEYKRRLSALPPPRIQRTCCGDLDVALAIDHFSRYFFPLSFVILNIVYWFTYAYPW